MQVTQTDLGEDRVLAGVAIVTEHLIGLEVGSDILQGSLLTTWETQGFFEHKSPVASLRDHL